MFQEVNEYGTRNNMLKISPPASQPGGKMIKKGFTLLNALGFTRIMEEFCKSHHPRNPSGRILGGFLWWLRPTGGFFHGATYSEVSSSGATYGGLRRCST